MQLANRHPSTQGIMRFFDFKHLPMELQEVSARFSLLAHSLLLEFPDDDPELVAALRKLRETKDCVVGLKAVNLAALKEDT